MDSQVKIFISFFHEEASLAVGLKEFLESAFPGQCEVFASCDRARLPAGGLWLEVVSKALRAAEVLIVVCSPRSVTRPWIYFEAGCALMKGIPIIPLCHSGITRGSLPAPLYVFQAVQLESNEFEDELVAALSLHLSVHAVTGGTRKQAMNRLREAQHKSQSPPSRPTSDTEGQAAESELDPFEAKILAYLAETHDPGPAADTLAKALSVSLAKMRHHLDRLVDGEYLMEQRSIMDRYPWYFLTRKGREHVVRHEWSP